MEHDVRKTIPYRSPRIGQVEARGIIREVLPAKPARDIDRIENCRGATGNTKRPEDETVNLSMDSVVVFSSMLCKYISTR